ncbi:branched-chain amino acid ABC transporter permease [Terrarubrum flagellatum]|uniref:branched-chain amino acid ABC transporter permease n=1 Tax=Terrirubrum flagellatum TaxID=2895980 RepID=UPI003144EB1B
MTSYLFFILTIGGVYALLAQSLNLIWGGAGMVNLGLAGFFAVGAYASAILTKGFGLPIAIGLIASLAAGAVAGFIVTISTARLRDDYLAIVTLGFAETVRLIALNEAWLTRGSDGISGIPGPWRAELGPNFHPFYCVFVFIIVAIVYLLTKRLDDAPYGRTLKAIREDPELAAFAGKKVMRFKIEAFALSAAVAGLAGAIYGHYTSYIAPDLFQPLITIYIFLAVTAGGLGRPIGPVIGAYLVIAFLEGTRFIVELIPGLGPVQVAATREMLIGAALILILRLRPQGLLPEQSRPVPRVGDAA